MARDIGNLLRPARPTEFEAGETVITNTYLQSASPARALPQVAYVDRGLVRGAWHRPAIAPAHRLTVMIAGDRRWIGLDAFKYAENLFRYTALVPTTAWVLPLSDLVDRLPREVLIDALESTSLAWCTAVSVVSLRGQKLHRRAMHLLYDLSRLHPRPSLQVTQKVVAELLGVSRQTLSPVLRQLQQKGLVRLGYGSVSIEDPTKIIEELRRTAGGTTDLDAHATAGWHT
jgi:CRP-like cAMP-binding protein